MKGSCLCGGVVFEVAEVAGPFELCHCSRCRKASGTAHLAFLGVRREGYRVVRGRDLIRRYAAPLVAVPPPYTVFFCTRCGSTLPDPDPDGDWLEVPAGLLDEDPGHPPDRHIYVDCKAGWDEPSTVLPEFTAQEIQAHRRKHGRVPPR